MKKMSRKIFAWLLCLAMLVTALYGNQAYALAGVYGAGQARVLRTESSAEPAELNFADIITKATMSSSTNIKMTDTFRVSMEFALPQDTADWRLEDHYRYTYDINAIQAVKEGETSGLAGLVAQTSTTEPQPVMMDGVNVGTYTIVDGVVSINFKDGLEYLKRSDISRVGTFEFQCGLEEDAYADEGGTYVLKFSSAATAVNPTITTAAKDVIKAGAKVSKSDAVFDAAAKTATYTITVENITDHAIANLVVEDAMGAYLRYDSILTAGVTVDAADAQHVKFTLASVPVGATSFQYVCKVDDDAFLKANSQGGSTYGLNNGITAKVNGTSIYIDNDSKTKQETSFKIQKDVVAKTAATAGEDTIEWTIYINRGATTFDLAGYQFEDSLDSGLVVDIDSVQVTGDNAEIKEGLKDAILNNSTYTFPAGSTGEYTIKYKTSVPAHEGLKQYRNQATVTDGTHIDVATATSAPMGTALAAKTAGEPQVDTTAGSATEGELLIPWTTKITVPTGPVTKLEYKDYMYSWYGHNGKGFVEDAGTVFTLTASNGATLVKDTDYTVAGNGLERTISFTPTGLGKVSGCEITITYQTVGNYKDRNYKDGNDTYTNQYELTYNTISEQGSASVVKPKEQPAAPDSYITKEASDVDKENHTITWKITVKASALQVLKDLVLEDTIAGMEYWGYKSTACSKDAPYVLIEDDSWMSFRYPVKIEDVSSAGTTKYKFTIDFSDDTKTLEPVNAWGDPADYLNKDAFAKGFSIYYTTKVCGDKLLYNNTTTYQNDVEASATVNDSIDPVTDHASASKVLETNVLTKDCEQQVLDGVNVLTYKIQVNPDGLKLNPNAAQRFYTVEDTMPSNQIWVNDPAKTVLTNRETGEPLTRVETAEMVKNAPAGSKYYHVSYVDNVLTFTVPDETPIQIQYKVTMLSDANQPAQSYVNTVQLAQPYVSNQSIVENHQSRKVSSSSMTMVGNRLFETSKVDAYDTTTYLEGATFTATEYIWDAGAWKASGNTYTLTTDSTGRAWDASYTKTAGSTGTNTKIEKNCYYEIRETVAPAGYTCSNQVYKVIVVDIDTIASTALDNLPADVYRITAGTELIFADVPSQTVPENKLVIKKVYYKPDGVTLADPLPAQNAKLEVYEGNLSFADCEGGMYTPISTGVVEGAFTYENADNKLTLKEIPDGTYTVYEKTAPDGYDRLQQVYHFTVTDHKISWEGEPAAYEPAEKTIANRQTFFNTLSIRKRYFKAADTGKTSPLTSIAEKAVFVCERTHALDASGQYVSVLATAEPMVTTDGFTYTLSGLPAGKYQITEAASGIYQADSRLPLTVTVTALGTIQVTDRTGAVITQDTGSSLVNPVYTIDNVIKDNAFAIQKTYYDASGAMIEARNIPQNQAGAVQKKVNFQIKKWNGTGNRAEKSSYQSTVEGVDYETYTLRPASNSGDADTYVWKNIEPGYYMAEETLQAQDPTEYEALQTVFFYVDETYKVHRNNQTTGTYEETVDVKNREVNGAVCRFYLEKYLADQAGVTQTLVTDEPATSGIDFALVRTSDTPVTSLAFSYNAAKGRWEAVGLTAGTYTVTETSTRAGYQAAEMITFRIGPKTVGTGMEIQSIRYGTAAENTNTEDFRISTIVEDGMETMVAAVINRPHENQIVLNKTYLQPEGAAAVHTENAVFTIYKKNGASDVLVGNMDTTNGNQYQMKNLDAGQYYIRETSAPEGFDRLADLPFTVAADYKIQMDIAVAGYAVTMNNAWQVEAAATNQLTNQVVLKKQFTYVDGTVPDASNLAHLRGTVAFGLFDAGNVPVAGKLTYDTTTGTIRVKDLATGTYYIRETTSAAGYQAAADIKLEVSAKGTITATYTGTWSDFTDLYGNTTTQVSATLYNRQQSNALTIQKKYYKQDGVTEIPIANVNQFASFQLTKDGSAVTGIGVTVSQRTGSYTFSNLLPGDYELTETAATGYQAVAAMQFTVGQDGAIVLPGTLPAGWTAATGAGTQTVTVTAKNAKIPNQLRLRKAYFDADGHEAFPDDTDPNAIAQFALVDGTGARYDMLYDNTTKLYSVKNVPSGTYSLVETAPAGYKESGAIAVVVAQAGTITAAYSGTDASDFAITGAGTTEDAVIYYKNHQVTNSITLHKSYVSATGEPLVIGVDVEDQELAEFRLYKDYQKTYQTEITGAKVVKNKALGVYTFMNLEPGEYTIVETAGGLFTAHINIKFSVFADQSIGNLSETALAGSDNFQKDIAVVNKRQPYENQFNLIKKYIDSDNQPVTDTSQYYDLRIQTDFVLIDAQGNEKTVSYDPVLECFQVKNLEPGEYIIREKNCPANYYAASDIRLRVIRTSPLDTVIYVEYDGVASEMECEQNATANPLVELKNCSTRYVHISKRSLAGTEELAGAVFKIVSADNDPVVPEWTSTTTPNAIAVGTFTTDKVYILKEVTAPFGYALAQDIYFKVDVDGNVTTSASEHGTYTAVDQNVIVVRDADKKLQIAKVDAQNPSLHLSGARMVIRDGAGQTVDREWVTDGALHELSAVLFTPDTDYTLTELEAPAGYTLAAPIRFRFDGDGSLKQYDEQTGTWTVAADGVLVMKDQKAGVTTEATTTEERTETEETDTTEERTETATTEETVTDSNSHGDGTGGAKTGDQMPLSAAAAMLFAGLLGIVILVKKRRTEDGI